MQLSLKQSGTAQLIHSVGNGMVWYLALTVSSSVVSTHTFGLLHSKGEGGGRVLAMKVFAFTVLLAEQYWK